MKEQKSVIQFQTKEGVNVTGRIKDGKTFRFKDIEEANKIAIATGSYVYDLYYYVVGKKERVVKQFGYAVPK